jgi:transposase
MESARQLRLRQVDRTKPTPSWSLDQTLPSDHPARTIWQYVSTLDLTAFLHTIRAIQGLPGRNATDPRILLAVWMYATADGVGAAREVDRLCREHLAYRWLCGGVTLNYHLLSDFRCDFETELDQLLTDHVAALMHQGLVHLKRVAQDGIRVRAHASAGSFHRASTIEECQTEVSEQLTILKQQSDEPPGTAARRSRSARKRHLCEQQQRLQEARKAALELEAKRAERARLHPKEATEGGEKFRVGRGSTSDPEARRMKMPDGGHRPAFNVQVASTTEEGMIVGVEVTNQGSDGGLMGPMVDQIEKSYGEAPSEILVDGGFSSVADVEKSHAAGIVVYMPLKNASKELAGGKDPYAPKAGDKAGMRALRQRMGTEEGKAIYKQRASTAEWVNAGYRNRGLYGVLVRGVKKVRAVVLLQSLVHNLFQTIRVCRLKKPNQSWTEILRAGLEKRGLADRTR